MARSYSEIYESADIEPHHYTLDNKFSFCDGCGKPLVEVCEKTSDKLLMFEFWEDNQLAEFCSRQEAAWYIREQELRRED